MVGFLTQDFLFFSQRRRGAEDAKKNPRLCVSAPLREKILTALLCVLCAYSAIADDADARVGQWMAKRAEDTAAWEALSGKWEQANTAMTTPVENLVLPVNHYETGREKGRVRTLLRAEKAQLLPDGLIFARNVRVELLSPTGKIEGVLVADDCLIERDTKRGYCQGEVDVQMGTDRLKGRGMYFSTEEQFIKILSECEIRTSRIPASLGRLS